jgi:putative ABC transport system permease protein
MLKSAIVFENVRYAFRSIRANLLRTILTMLIIAFGIMALVGILTATDSIKGAINSNLTRLGANTFSITTNRSTRARQGSEVQRTMRPLSFSEALEFRERYTFTSVVSVSALASFNGVIKHGQKETNPNVQVFGVDENYLKTSGYEIERGRNFSHTETEAGRNVVLLGYDIAGKIFKKTDRIIDQEVTIGNRKYTVIGVLKTRGSTFGSSDNLVFVPIRNARATMLPPQAVYAVSVMAGRPDLMGPAIAEARGLMRNIRRVRLKDADGFEIRRSDSLANTLIENLQSVAIAASGIGFITLLSAAIALMNILLVSVTERTREIGVSKAIGAKQAHIKTQFLVEAIVICQIGGALGIVFGILVGNIMSTILGSPFIVPWLWIVSGIALCFVVGVVSGLYPAAKAARLDPIEALRHE